MVKNTLVILLLVSSLWLTAGANTNKDLTSHPFLRVNTASEARRGAHDSVEFKQLSAKHPQDNTDQVPADSNTATYDPTRPTFSPSHGLVADQNFGKTDLKTMKLSMTNIPTNSPNKSQVPSAIINGETVVVGDTVREYCVIAIRLHSVVLSYACKHYSLFLHDNMLQATHSTKPREKVAPDSVCGLPTSCPAKG